jgi:hypothetical protein
VAAITPLRLLALVLALSGAIALSTPVAASAATPCWNRILDDWWDNERIDGTYSLKCYREAEENMSQDLRDYSDLPGEIARARQRALRAGSEEEDTRVVQSAGPVDERTDSDGVAGDGGGGSDDGGPIHSALEELGPSSADSPPIPLLVLAGLALLLVAAGAAGLLSRRLQARRARVTPPIDPEP